MNLTSTLWNLSPYDIGFIVTTYFFVFLLGLLAGLQLTKFLIDFFGPDDGEKEPLPEPKIIRELVELKPTNINDLVDFDNVAQCKKFLNSMHINGTKLEFIELQDGTMLDIKQVPDDQIIPLAKRMRSIVYGDLKKVGGGMDSGG